MQIALVNSFVGEWIKKRRSAASWLTITGGFFIPAIVLISRFDNFKGLAAANASPQLWEGIYGRCWQFMAFFFLPMGIILASSLITQLEFKNNTWKQLHTTPQSLTTIYFAKLGVIVTMMVQFFILFNIGIYLAAVIPAVFKGVPYPVEPMPVKAILNINGQYFISSLPIIALQYLISLQFKNFLVPVGAGLAMYVAAMFATGWRFGYILPYSYCALTFLAAKKTLSVNIQAWALVYFIVFTIAGYILYITKKVKG